jgi:hypothetical protein
MRIAVSIAIAAVILLALSPVDAHGPVTFTSPCACEGNHGVERWAEKTDVSDPPANGVGIRAITPGTMASWGDAGGGVTRNGRQGLENTWFAVTGRLTKVKLEDDGDLHLTLEDVGKPGRVVVEIPLGDRWCALRTKVFSWAAATFPLSAGKSLKLNAAHIITVTGKAFYDAGHAGGANQRSYDADLAVWEIHPVMQLAESTAAIAASVQQSAPVIFATPAPAPPIAAAPSTAPRPQTTPAAAQVAVLTKPVTIAIPYGQTVIPAGTRLPVVGRDATTIRVDYMGQIQAIPLDAANLL